MAKLYDAVILGATPAGFAAATALAKAKRAAVVVDTPTADAPECPLLDWAPKQVFEPPCLPKIAGKAAKAEPFRIVRYHDAALERSTEHKGRDVLGYFVSRGDLQSAMKSLANKAGITVRTSSESMHIRVSEGDAGLEGERSTRGRVLLIGQGRPASVLSELGLPSRIVGSTPMTTVGLDIPLPASRQPGHLRETLHVVEMPERSEIGMFFANSSVLHVRVVSMSVSSGTRAAEISSLLSRLQQAQLLPKDLPLGKASGAIWLPPAGVALDQETHDAKNVLLIGSAGGFAESISGQSLLAGVRSGQLAAETVLEALSAETPQQALRGFNPRWRDELADYLRPPSTSLAMLLPLLFVNQRIVTKFTRALLYGEDI